MKFTFTFTGTHGQQIVERFTDSATAHGRFKSFTDDRGLYPMKNGAGHLVGATENDVVVCTLRKVKA